MPATFCHDSRHGPPGSATMPDVSQASRTPMALINVKTSRSVADYTACIVQTRSAADLAVCVVESRATAKDEDGLWCYMESASTATSKLCWVESRGVADLLVCFVTSRAEAGWRRDHKLKGKL